MHLTPIDSRPISRRRKLRRKLRCALAVALMASTGIASLSGCGVLNRVKPGPRDNHTSYHDDYGVRIEYPEVQECTTAARTAAEQSAEPMALEDPSQLPSA